MRRDKHLQINKICQEIEENSLTNSTKEFYPGIRSLTNKFRPTNETVKDKSGNKM